MIPPILQRVRAAGHDVYDNGSYDLNIIGIRSANRTAGEFDDWVCIVCKDVNGLWLCHWMPATTDPGNPRVRRGGHRRVAQRGVLFWCQANGRATSSHSTEESTPRYVNERRYRSTATPTGMLSWTSNQSQSKRACSESTYTARQRALREPAQSAVFRRGAL